MKGVWLQHVPRRVIDGSLSVVEALKYVLWRVARPRSLTVEGVRFEGVDFLLWGLITEIFIAREYTPQNFEIGPDDVVVDIGSHRGVFVAFAANRTSGQIVAVEPDETSYGFLRGMVEKNNLANVTLVHAAVSGISGKARLFHSAGSSRHTLAGVDQATGEPLHNGAMVQTVTLEELLASQPVVHFLKMDCEGAEYDVFETVQDSLLGKIERLVMEVHGLDQEERSGSLLRRLNDRFQEVSVRRISDTMAIVYALRDAVSGEEDPRQPSTTCRKN